MTSLRLLAAGAAALVAIGATNAPAQRLAPAPADLILVNTKIYTVDDSHPFAEAMAVRGGRVAFVGSTHEALLLRGPSTQVLDLAGRTVIPGMVDAHAHLFELGTFLRDIDLTDTRSFEAIVARVGERVKGVPAGRWVIGRGWDQNKWGDTRFPTHDALSRVTPNNPVVLGRIDGHAVLANAAAMKAAGVTAATRDPAGGRIERTAAGEPTGVFVDNAMSLVEKVVPPLSHDEMRSASLAAISESNRWGLVGLHDPGEPREVLDVFEELAKENKFNLRVYAMISDDSAAIEHYFQIGPRSSLYDNHLWIRAIKLYADGALGSRGAALLDPYADDPKNNGLLKSTPEHLRDVSIRALQHGFQVATHAIGDRGNRVALDAYQAALEKVPTVDHRFRIEHVQVLDHADIPRFAQLGVIPSMQSVHQTSDMYWAATQTRTVTCARRLCVAVAARDRCDRSERQRLPGGAGESALLLSRRRLPAGRARLAAGRLVPGAAHDARRSAQVHDDLAGLRGLSGTTHGVADAGKARRLRRPGPRYYGGAGVRNTRNSGARHVYWRKGGLRTRSLGFTADFPGR